MFAARHLAGPEVLPRLGGSCRPSGRRALCLAQPSYSRRSAGYMDGKHSGFPTFDMDTRIRLRDVELICDSARRMGLSEQKVRATLDSLSTLLPGFHPSLQGVHSDLWAPLLQSPDAVVNTIIALKRCYPGGDAGAMIAAHPPLLRVPPRQLEADAQQVRALLQPGVGDEALLCLAQLVPQLLTSPRELDRILEELRVKHPDDDPLERLQRDPAYILLSETAVNLRPSAGRAWGP